MSYTVQKFLAASTEKAATDLAEAYLRIPEDKRNWKPEGKARSPIDIIAECVILNGYSVDLILSRKWSDNNFANYTTEKASIEALDWEHLSTLLQTNTSRVISAIEGASTDTLEDIIEMPWGSRTFAEFLAYPYWNMSYHLGQINYIASMLGCLE